MLRNITRTIAVIALAGFILPGTNYTAEAGSGYKNGGKKSWVRGKTRAKGYRRNNGFILRIPQTYLDGTGFQDYRPKRRAGEYGIDAKPWRSGPKIIKVEEVLRERRRLEQEQ